MQKAPWEGLRAFDVECSQTLQVEPYKTHFSSSLAMDLCLGMDSMAYGGFKDPCKCLLDLDQQGELLQSHTCRKPPQNDYTAEQKVIITALLYDNMDLMNEEDRTARRKKIVRDREHAWNFVISWSDELFCRQFRLPKPVFFSLCERLKAGYPGPRSIGYENYLISQRQGKNSTPDSGPITMEIKLAITLRLLAGASELDMIWYGVQLSSVNTVFHFVINLIDQVLTNDEIFNFNPENNTNETQFEQVVNQIASEWSSIMVEKKVLIYSKELYWLETV